MATSTNYGWAEPDNSSLVKNGASDMRTLGNAIDTSVWNITKGQAGKNILINGLMDIWQRSTSAATSGDSINAQDRWYNYATTSTTVSQESSTVPAGCRYSAKYTVGASAAAIQSGQVIETLNAMPYAGQTMTLSGYFQSSATPTVTFVVQYSTAVDVTYAGSWTTIAATSGGSGAAGSSSFTRISGVYAIPSTAKSLKIQWYTGSMASASILYCGGMQFEAGSTATQVSRNGGTIQGELAACQRYYQRISNDGGNAYSFLTNYGMATTTGKVRVNYPFKVPMRIAPTALDYSTLAITNDDGNVYSVSSATLDNTTTSNIASIAANTGSTITQYRPYFIGANNSASAYIGFSAEL